MSTCQRVVVNAFGGPKTLEICEESAPKPQHGEVLVRITSIGMNHAELMARRGEYKIASGEPPFTPGLEAGGVIEAVGQDVAEQRIGQRVILTPDAPRHSDQGSYRSHIVIDAEQAMVAPDVLPDDQLGAVWLAYLTAWGCLVWKQGLRPGQIVAIPAASSSVGLAAAQVVKACGATAIGMTSSPQKATALETLETARFDHMIVTHDSDGMRPWHRDMRTLTQNQGVDVFFDPVASGAYLNTEIKCLADFGCVWVYGLLGEHGIVDVTPLIRKRAAIRGWVLSELIAAGRHVWEPMCQTILDKFASGEFKQYIGERFRLADVVRAHEQMEAGKHIGKLVLQP